MEYGVEATVEVLRPNFGAFVGWKMEAVVIRGCVSGAWCWVVFPTQAVNKLPFGLMRNGDLGYDLKGGGLHGTGSVFKMCCLRPSRHFDTHMVMNHMFVFLSS